MILCGYNCQIKKTIFSLFVLLSNEKEGTFKFLFSYLKEKYNFNPRNIMFDYSLGQIKAVKKIFQDIQIHCCFFHFSHAIWHRFKAFNLYGKETYEKNSELLFNRIKQMDKENKYKSFFDYFSRT